MDYSAWNIFQNWKNRSCQIAGDTAYHFIAHAGKLLRVGADGAEATEVKSLSFAPAYLFFEGGRLWLSEKNPGSQVFRVWSMDPETLEARMEVDFSKIAKNYDIGYPFITASGIFFLALRPEERALLLHYAWGSGTVDALYSLTNDVEEEACFDLTFEMLMEHIFAITDDAVVVGDHLASEMRFIDIRTKSIESIFKHPDIARILPVIAQIKKISLPTLEECDYEFDYEELMENFATDNIVFLDFKARMAYLGEPMVINSTLSGQQFCISFDACKAGDATVYWNAPQTFCVARSAKAIKNEEKYRLFYRSGNEVLFDGRHAVGRMVVNKKVWDTQEGVDWGFQTPEGGLTTINFCDGNSECHALLGDWLYLYQVGDRNGWCKFHLEQGIPERLTIQ